MAAAPALTPGLLRELEDCWRDQDLPLVQRLQPGLSHEQIDALTAPLGLRLPTEALLWWTWRDGAVAEDLAIERELGPGFEFLPLAQAVEQCVFQRKLAAEFGESPADAEFWWHTSWFPITHRGGAVACDCSVAKGAPTPIFSPFSHDLDVDGRTHPAALSFGQMVRWWIEAFEEGIWRYDAIARSWDYRRENRPPARERLV